MYLSSIRLLCPPSPLPPTQGPSPRPSALEPSATCIVAYVAQRPPHHARHVRPCSVPARPLGKQQESFSSRPPALALRPPPSPSALAVAGISSSSRAKWEGRSGRGPAPNKYAPFLLRAGEREAATGGGWRRGPRRRALGRRNAAPAWRGPQRLAEPEALPCWRFSRWRSAAGGGWGGRLPSPASHSRRRTLLRHRQR